MEFDKVRDFIVEQLGVDAEQVTPEASFVNDLSADSLDLIELIMALEEELNLDISDDDAERLKTVNDAWEYIKSHI